VVQVFENAVAREESAEYPVVKEITGTHGQDEGLESEM
jgi:hypothetical protein